ncbi:hypothetical protein EDC01DRAFT_650354, partial [Geopyxis carbonaria]
MPSTFHQFRSSLSSNSSNNHPLIPRLIEVKCLCLQHSNNPHHDRRRRHAGRIGRRSARGASFRSSGGRGVSGCGSVGCRGRARGLGGGAGNGDGGCGFAGSDKTGSGAAVVAGEAHLDVVVGHQHARQVLGRAAGAAAGLAGRGVAALVAHHAIRVVALHLARQSAAHALRHRVQRVAVLRNSDGGGGEQREDDSWETHGDDRELKI